MNNPATPMRPGGVEGPVYPRVTRAEGDFFETEDPHTLIESITWPDANAPHAPEIVYVAFGRKQRWRMWGDCYRCGIADANMHEDGSFDFGEYNIVLEPGKHLGEKYSVLDRDYSGRKDYPCTPGYPAAARRTAAELSVPYVCGLQFAELGWIY